MGEIVISQMKKWARAYSGIAVFAVLVTWLLAPSPNAWAQTEPSPHAGDARLATPAMWRISDEDSEIWLLGTFHILPPDIKWRSPALEEALNAAETVYFEVEADTPAAQQRTVQILMAKGYNPPGSKLSDLLGKKDAAKLQAIAQELNLPMAAIDTMRPWQAFLAISVQLIVKQGFDPSAGVDSVLIAEMRAQGRNVRYLETIDQQLSFFTDLSPESEKNLLVFTLREWDTQKEDITKLLDAWAMGDVESIDKVMNESMQDLAPEVFETLIVNRNKVWAERLAHTMTTGSGQALVAVGAAHLVGEYSVPTLLEAKGFQVERYNAESGTSRDPVE